VPFTLAHPVAVLPLRRILPLSALVIGSMTPDLEFPLRLAAVSRFSHTLPAVLYFCIPAGMLLLLTWRLLVRRPMMQLVPDGMRARLFSGPDCPGFVPAGRLPVFVAALATGALTHIFWDSFTHDYGWVVVRWPALQANLLSVDGHELRVYKLLQWGSSAFGVLALGALASKRILPSGQSAGARVPQQSSRRAFSAAIVLLTLSFSTGMAILSASLSPASAAPRIFATQFAICGMIAFAICMVVYSTMMNVAATERREGRRNQRRTTSNASRSPATAE
jgi:hypothetical protein